MFFDFVIDSINFPSTEHWVQPCFCLFACLFACLFVCFSFLILVVLKFSLYAFSRFFYSPTPHRGSDPKRTRGGGLPKLYFHISAHNIPRKAFWKMTPRLTGLKSLELRHLIYKIEALSLGNPSMELPNPPKNKKFKTMPENKVHRWPEIWSQKPEALPQAPEALQQKPEALPQKPETFPPTRQAFPPTGQALPQYRSGFASYRSGFAPLQVRLCPPQVRLCPL